VFWGRVDIQGREGAREKGVWVGVGPTPPDGALFAMPQRTGVGVRNWLILTNLGNQTGKYLLKKGGVIIIEKKERKRSPTRLKKFIFNWET